jgi:hypothetical protein
VVPEIGDVDVARALVDVDPDRTVELAVAGAVGAESGDVFATRGELLDPVVVVVGDEDVAFAVDRRRDRL